ncbi:MAG: hypothetical protein R3Y28_08365 [Candidatus Gastranaerophilales bacterium]
MVRAFIMILCLFLATNTSFAKKEEIDTTGKGYVGTLPELSSESVSDEPDSTKPVYKHTKNFNSSQEVKPAPRDNPSFVNIILKSDKNSQYLNDINEFIPMLEKIFYSIEQKESLQLFVARVYFLNEHCNYLRDKYLNKPESNFISFRELMKTNLHAQSISLLRVEAKRFSPYLAYSEAGSVYNEFNIDQQLEYLKIEIEETIYALKDAN